MAQKTQHSGKAPIEAVFDNDTTAEGSRRAARARRAINASSQTARKPRWRTALRVDLRVDCDVAKVVQQIVTTTLAVFLLWGSQSRDDRAGLLIRAHGRAAQCASRGRCRVLGGSRPHVHAAAPSLLGKRNRNSSTTQAKEPYRVCRPRDTVRFLLHPRAVMPSADQIKALVRSHLERNDVQFLSIAMQIAAYEARKGHGKLADELRTLIDESKARQSALNLPDRAPTPIAKPRGELSSLVTSSYPHERVSSMVVSEAVGARLARVIREQQHFVRIREHGLSPRRKLLLVGPPGTGKTLTASVLAGELGLALFQVRLDALISKFMGETAAKLRLLFDSVRDHRAVYFFDEFDAIASQRGLGNDVGEIRRVLNSFLQLLEQDQSNGLIVAATNHPEILDYAVFRRFDDVIEYELPGLTQISETLRARMGDLAGADIGWDSVAQRATGLSYADITRAADEAIKEAIIADQRAVTEVDLVHALDERRSMHLRRRDSAIVP
jgi:AAA+ superfamily predicted ATPase